MRRGWRLIVVGAALLVATSCTDDKPPPDHTDDHPEETAPSTSVAPETVPPTTAALGEQVNTVEAAQRLLDLFAHLDGEAVRMLLQKGAPDAEFDQALQAVYVGQELRTAREVFEREARLKFAGYARPQPDVIFRATRLIDSRRNDCVVVAGVIDNQPRYTNPVTRIDGIFVLVVPEGVVPSGGNPTRWRILVSGQPKAGTDLEAVCPGL